MKARSGVKVEFSSLYLNGQSVDLTVADGVIATITPVPGPARAVILPLPIEPHVHLDKTHTVHRCVATKPGLFGAIDAMVQDLGNWTAEDLRMRINRGMEGAYANGVAAIRSHVDWTAPDVPLAWEVMGEVAQGWRARLPLQRASLSGIDLLGDPDHGPAIAARVASDGAVLGCFIYRHADIPDRLARVFRLAQTHGLRLDFHVDEGLEPEANAFDDIVRMAAEYGMGGRVLCGHACSLSIRPDVAVARVLDAAGRAGVALTVMPTTNLHLQDMAVGRTPRLRGLAPMQELRAAGVQVLLGTDNVRDPFYPFGSYDPLEVLRLATLAAHLTPGDWLEAITTAPARALGLAEPAIAVGQPADFILIDGADWAEALSSPRAIRQIYRGGMPMTGKAPL